MIEMIPVDTPSLGDRSYFVTDGEVTFVDAVTAQRELIRIGIDRPAAGATGGPAD